MFIGYAWWLQIELEAPFWPWARVMLTTFRCEGDDHGSPKAPVGRPSQNRVKRFYKDFEYQAASWDKPRRVIAKIEWHPGELFPRVGFIVTKLPMNPDWVVRF